MKYTVRIMSSKNTGHYEKSKRYNNVSKRILKFLIRNKFCFTTGINYSRNTVYDRYAYNYIEVYLKPEHFLDYGEIDYNKWCNNKLERFLKRYKHAK